MHPNLEFYFHFTILYQHYQKSRILESLPQNVCRKPNYVCQEIVVPHTRIWVCVMIRLHIHVYGFVNSVDCRTLNFWYWY